MFLHGVLHPGGVEAARRGVVVDLSAPKLSIAQGQCAGVEVKAKLDRKQWIGFAVNLALERN